MKQLKYVVVVMSLFSFVPAFQVNAMATTEKLGRSEYSGEKLECNLREAKRIAAQVAQAAAARPQAEPDVVIVGSGSEPK